MNGATGVALACVVPFLLPACASNAGDPVALDGLSQPRGLSVDGGELCVAEAGRTDGPGGADVSGEPDDPAGQIEADTGRVSCVPLAGGDPSVVVDGLPFVYYPDAAVTSGAADVTRSDGSWYVLVGESYGERSRSIVEITSSGTRLVADVGQYADVSSEAIGFHRSNPYSFVPALDGSGFFVSEAAAGTILHAGVDGSVELAAEVAGHEVLTGLTWGADERLYVASFGQLPHPVGSGAIVAVDADGSHEVVLEGLTMAVDVAFDDDGGMLVLEYATPPDDPAGVEAYRDRSGRLLHVAGPVDEVRVLRADLNRPTALEVVGDDVFVSISAGELAAAEGSVVRLSLAELLQEATGAVSSAGS